MANDIDSADVPELRRRIVEPVLGAMLHPGELTALSLAIEMPQSEHWIDPHWVDSEPGVWLRLDVHGEKFEHRLCKPGFWLDDAQWIAAELESELQDWICESHFGWGDMRSVPDDVVLPAPAAVPAGARVVSVHFGDDGQFPLWEAGSPADVNSLGLTDSLRADLAAWQARGEQYAGEANATRDAPSLPSGGPFGVRIEYIDDLEQRARRGRVDQRRRQVLAEWHLWVGEFEPWRDRLVVQLRRALGAEFRVVEPPRFPILR